MSVSEPFHNFTPDEVNALIPQMEDHFKSFWGYRQNAQNVLHELRKNVKDTPTQTPAEIAQQQIRQSQAHYLLEQAQKKLDAVVDLGGVIKDLEMGLVDFHHILEFEEEIVFLCWKYGEKKVRFWHGVHEGFDSRKPFVKRTSPSA